MIEVPEAVAARLQFLPESPGVYLWKNAAGEVLYVGKAKRLRSRVRSYYSTEALRTSPKTLMLMRQAVDVETIVVPSEEAALLLESNLIKEHRPRYNINLRDDKSYPFIKVTVQEPYPRVFVTRRIASDGARYFGPYTDVGAMRRSLNIVKRIFTVRSCSYDMPREMPARPCLDFHIGRCKAPCAGYQSEADYNGMIREVVAFLDGKSGEAVKVVGRMMQEASERLDFERAAQLRDAIRALQSMEEPAAITRLAAGDSDIVGMARDADDAVVSLLRVRNGKLLAREHRFLEHVEGESEASILAAWLIGSYFRSEGRAEEVVLPFSPEDAELISSALAGGRMVVATRGPRRELADLAEQNARHLLEEYRLSTLETDERAADPVYELAREIGMQRIPRSLVCFDISTAQGTDTVGSCVWFESGRPRRAEYRRYKVKTVEGTDDFASMREVVHRFFRRRLEERRSLPDLVVVDGGKGQLGVAREALDEFQLSIPVISLAKRDEEIFLPGRAEPLRLPRRSAALRLLQRARDEAHRVAVTYNRDRRTRRTVTSELMSVPGIGPARRTALLHRFGSLDAVRKASAEEIATVRGFSLSSAERLLQNLRRQ